jgi:hypothetical protein
VTRADLLTLAAEYRELLGRLGARPRHLPDTRYRIDDCSPTDRRMMLNHLAWVCEHVGQVVDSVGGHQKAIRWIGCVQGALAAYGLVTVEETRKRFEEFPLANDAIR